MQLLKADQTSVVSAFTGSLKDFYNFHGIQLLASQFPVELIEQLYEKLGNDTYDAGDSFKIMDNNDRETFEVHSTRALKKHADVFLVDHVMTFRYPEFREMLEAKPALLDKIENITKYLGNKLQFEAAAPNTIPDPRSVQFDSMDLHSTAGLTVAADCVCLSLVDNNLSNESEIMELIRPLQQLKVLWVMDNPIEHSQTLREFVIDQTRIEVFNSKLTKRSTEWALKYLTYQSISQCESTKDDQVVYLNLDGRELFNTDLSTLNKLVNLRRVSIRQTTVKDIDSINKLIQLLTLPSLQYIDCDFQLEVHIFELYETKKLQISKNLLVNDHNIYMPKPTPTSHRIGKVHNRVFKIAGNYRLSSTEKLDETSIWYVNDEFGSAITHTDKPQCIIAPFLYAPNNSMDGAVVAYSLMWLVEDLYQGQLVERDYLNGLKQTKQRSSRLSVWYQVPKQLYINLYHGYNQNMAKITAEFKQNQTQNQLDHPVKQKYKVITTSELIPQYLTLEEFEMTKEIEEADIMWIQSDVRDNKDIMALNAKGVILNQFPFQSCLVLKNNLANTIQSTLGDTDFLQRTYNLETELPIFLGHFFSNQQLQQDNLWISKPPNMARSMDMLVSNNLQILIRNMQTGPKLVQKYITYPVRRLNRKIDLRFVVVVKSIDPLNIYLYKHFWIRTSNNEYNVDCRFREVYETHFTVMNYGKKLTQVNYPEFIDEFNKDYSPIQWSTMMEKIKDLVRQTFVAASNRYPQMQSANSRATYGIDIMIDEQTMLPKLLEFTFSPDCIRACKFYPSFFNDIFEVLFLNKNNQNVEPLF